MRTGPPGGTVASMGTPLLRVTIELDPGDPIEGRIERAGEPTQPFRGWFELSNRLERLRAGAAPTKPSPPDDEKGRSLGSSR
jgi:hypothetical protein